MCCSEMQNKVGIKAGVKYSFLRQSRKVVAQVLVLAEHYKSSVYPWHSARSSPEASMKGKGNEAKWCKALDTQS